MNIDEKVEKYLVMEKKDSMGKEIDMVATKILKGMPKEKAAKMKKAMTKINRIIRHEDELYIVQATIDGKTKTISDPKAKAAAKGFAQNIKDEMDYFDKEDRIFTDIVYVPYK